MKIIKLKCDSCGAVLKVNKELKNVTCNYCCSSFLLDDEIKRVEINKNIKYTDEAKLKEQYIKEKELDYIYRDNKLKMFFDLLKNEHFISTFLLIIIFGALFLLHSFAFGPDDNEIIIPLDAKKYKGENYKQVVQELTDAGFEDVDAELIYDIVTGWLTEDGEVEKVSIGGDTEFEEGEYASEDAHVVVTYHTYKKNKKK